MRDSIRSYLSRYTFLGDYRKFRIFDADKQVFTNDILSVPLYASQGSSYLGVDWGSSFFFTGTPSYGTYELFAIKYKDVYALCFFQGVSTSGGSLEERPTLPYFYDSSLYINGARSTGEYFSINSSLKDAFFFIADCVYSRFLGNSSPSYTSYFIRSISIQYPFQGDFGLAYHWTMETYNFFCLVDGFICCDPDFSPIVKSLGGSPSSVQLDNLKSIFELLGIDTSENGLKDCDLMKDYLKRLVSFLGGTPSSEPNDNLKSICQLLGVDSSENDLKDCELSKDYVKRISKMLGAENA